MDIFYNPRVLAHVSRCNSFAGAVRDLSVSTSTIMRAMDALEAHVGMTLLTRSTRHVDLTEAGHGLLSGTLPLGEETEGLIRQLRDRETELVGHLRITAAFSFGRSILADLVRDFLMQHPNITIDDVLSDGIVDLDQQNIDLAIRISDPGDAPDLVAHELRPVKGRPAANRTK